MSSSRVFAASSPGLIGAALAAVAFGAAGGTALGRTTVVELVLVLVGGLIVAAGIAYGGSSRLYGGAALAAFAAFATLTGLSVLWSVVPDFSYVEAGRTLAYLAVFAAAVTAGRLSPRTAPVLAKAIVVAAGAVVAYSIASRIWPESLAKNELSNRIGAPYSYWNAVGTTAALVVPAALWLGARRTGSLAGRALAYPVLGMAVLAILLTESRGALVAAAIGVIAWFAIVPLRLRSLPVVLLPIAGAAPLAAWALSKTAFSKPLQPLAVKESVGGEFGGLVLLMVLVLLVAGWAVGLLLSRRAPSIHLRKRAGVVAVAAACAIPLALFTSVAFSQRGIGDTIGDRVHQLTNEAAVQPGSGSARLTTSSNSRAAFWREAGRIYKHHKLLGTGAGTFGEARLPYRKTDLNSRHAHGFIPQTLSDTGLVGLGVVIALLLAWLFAAGRATSLYPRRLRRGRKPERRDWTGERIALVSLVLVAVVFGLQSAIDWTWYVPGPTVMALAAAGFVAGRGPVPALATGAPGPASMPALPVRERLSRVSPAKVLAAVGVVVTAGLFAWAIWQPEASNRQSDQALRLADQGDLAGAADRARDAASTDPLASGPLLTLATIQAKAGQDGAALGTLERAVHRYPGEPVTWLRLASFQLHRLNRPQAAIRSVEAALYLDPRSLQARHLYWEAVNPPRR